MKRIAFTTSALVFVLILNCNPVVAQATAQISGRVQDATGAVTQQRRAISSAIALTDCTCLLDIGDRQMGTAMFRNQQVTFVSKPYAGARGSIRPLHAIVGSVTGLPDGTVIRNVLKFQSPFGVLGAIVDKLIM